MALADTARRGEWLRARWGRGGESDGEIALASSQHTSRHSLPPSIARRASSSESNVVVAFKSSLFQTIHRPFSSRVAHHVLPSSAEIGFEAARISARDAN